MITSYGGSCLISSAGDFEHSQIVSITEPLNDVRIRFGQWLDGPKREFKLTFLVGMAPDWQGAATAWLPISRIAVNNCCNETICEENMQAIFGQHGYQMLNMQVNRCTCCNM